MKLTIKEIAELAGVSITTVSQILNNKGSRFSEKTRRRVLDIVEEYQYKPDFFASNLINRHSKTIGMIVPDVTDFFFSKVIEGVETYLNPLGYMILLCNSKHSHEQEKRYIDELRHRSVDGILLATPNVMPEEYRFSADGKKVPMILMDRGINQRDEGKLIVKEYEGAYRAMSHLIAQGHRKIGMLRETTRYYQLTERITAYHHALKDHHIELGTEYVQIGDLSISGGYQAAKKLLAETNDVTAIFCGNDEMAIGAYHAISEMGKRIPKDISVVGFDGLEITEYMVPSLTTVRQPSFDIGFYAAKFLVDAIDNPNMKIPNKIFESELIVRESTKGVDSVYKSV